MLVEVLRYKPEGGGFDSRWCHWNFSGRTVVLGSTQPLTEMSTRNISWGVKATGAKGWQPYHLHVLIVLKSGSLNLLEPSVPVQACNGIAFICFALIKYFGISIKIIKFYYWWYTSEISPAPIIQKVEHKIKEHNQKLSTFFTRFTTKITCWRKFCKSPAETWASAEHNMNTTALNGSRNYSSSYINRCFLVCLPRFTLAQYSSVLHIALIPWAYC